MRIIEDRWIFGEISPFETFLVGPVTQLSGLAHTENLDKSETYTIASLFDYPDSIFQS